MKVEEDYGYIKIKLEDLIKENEITPVYNFINGRLAEKPTVLKPLS